MVLPAASAPPAVVVNESVAAADVLPATRSGVAIANETSVTLPPITPDWMLGEDNDEIDKYISELGIAAPSVKPLMVAVNPAVVPIVAFDVVRIIFVLVVAPHVIFSPGTLVASSATTGVTDGAKKLDGYVNVMEPPGGIAAGMLKVRVTGTPVFAAMRSAGAMVMESVLKHGLCRKNP